MIELPKGLIGTRIKDSDMSPHGHGTPANGANLAYLDSYRSSSTRDRVSVRTPV